MYLDLICETCKCFLKITAKIQFTNYIHDFQNLKHIGLNGVSTMEVSNMLNAMSAVGSASSRHGSHVASLEILDECVINYI